MAARKPAAFAAMKMEIPDTGYLYAPTYTEVKSQKLAVLSQPQDCTAAVNFDTQCVELGFDTKSLSEILGQSSIVTTLSVYAHPTMQQKKQQMERLSLSLTPSEI